MKYLDLELKVSVLVFAQVRLAGSGRDTRVSGESNVRSMREAAKGKQSQARAQSGHPVHFFQLHHFHLHHPVPLLFWYVIRVRLLCVCILSKTEHI